MSSPRVGVVRDSMLTNPLLIKAPLGQTKSRGLMGPGPDFTYGTCNTIRDGGVAEAVSSWRVQPRRGDSAPHRPAAPDFVALNRDAVRSGLTTSRELSQYRAQARGAPGARGARGARRPDPGPGGPPDGRAARRPAVPDISFGVTTRAPSPLSALLSHQYAGDWLNEQLSRNHTSNHKQLDRIKPGCIPDTRTTLLRRSRAPPLPPPPCTQHLLSQVPAALDTFRDPGARQLSFRAHQWDSVSRRGVQGLD